MGLGEALEELSEDLKLTRKLEFSILKLLGYYLTDIFDSVKIVQPWYFP